jgi:cytochrome c oxidase cbb3-type subunit 3
MHLKSGAALAAAWLTFPAAIAAEADGRAVYNFRCYYCHGYSGNAQTVAASFLTPPPASFTAATPATLPEESIVRTLRDGRPGTAMKSFAQVISDAEIRAVARFVYQEFVVNKAVNTHYHTAENGWPQHAERYGAAFPFARGEIPLSRPWEELTPDQIAGKRLFMSTCITCHDRGSADDSAATWDARPLSYPRNNFSFTAPPPPDALASASPYALHDIAPKIANLSPAQRRGETIFQKNCAFCHAADGTGKNWIGSFLEPHPRNLRDPEFMSGLSRERFVEVVRNGLNGTSMPAWKDVLSARQISDLAAYVERAFHPFRKPQQASDIR